MSVTAYASAGLSPYVSQVDADVLQAALPTTVQFYGAGYDTSDPGATFTYLWSIISQPPGSTAAFASATAQNPVLNNVTDWGNIIVALVVTNTATTESSEGDILLMPDTARCTVHVISTAGELENTARGERNWFIPGYWPLVSKVDQHAQILATLTGSIQPGGTLQVQAGAALAAGDVVYPSGITLVSGVTYLVVNKALATNSLVLKSQLFVMEAAVLSGALGTARLFGLSVINPAGAPAVLDSVYVSDTATLSLTAGTNSRTVGQVVQSGSGLYRFYAAGSPAGGGSASAQVLLTAPDGDFPSGVDISDISATLPFVDKVGALNPGISGAPLSLVFDKAATGAIADTVVLPMLLRNAHATPALTIAGGMGASWVDPTAAAEIGNLQLFVMFLGSPTPVAELEQDKLTLMEPAGSQPFTVESVRLILNSTTFTRLKSDGAVDAYIDTVPAWRADAPALTVADFTQPSNMATLTWEPRVPRRRSLTTTNATTTVIDQWQVGAVATGGLLFLDVTTRVMGASVAGTDAICAERRARFLFVEATGTVSMISGPYVPVPDDALGVGTPPSVTLDATGAFVRILVTGVAATTMKWTSHTSIELHEVT